MSLTIETDLTKRIAAEYAARVGSLPLAVSFHAQADAGAKGKPCVVVTASTEQLEHPRLSKVTVEVMLVLQLDDTATDEGSETMREIWSQLGPVMEEVCDQVTTAGVYWIRKVRPLGVESSGEGERAWAWTLPVEVWVEEYAA